jgi:WD40 repeat protein
MPASLLSALTRASMLVIVGTRGAAASTHIGKEIAIFVRRKRPIIPVDLDGAIPGAVGYPVIQGLVLERETREDALDIGLPSASVMSRIERSFTYRRRNERIQRVFRLTMAGILLGFAMLGVVSYRANRVQSEFQQVSDTLKGVETRLTSTRRDLDSKASQLEKAQEDIEQAEQDLVSTRQSVRIAEQEAQRQGRISRSRALSSTADVLLSQQAAFLPRSTLLAIEAIRRFPTLEADQALRGALALLPMPWKRVASDDPIVALAFSPDGRLLAAAGTNGVNVRDAASGQLRHRLTPGGRFSSIAFAPDGARVMAVADNQIHLWKLVDGSHQRIETRGPVQDLDVSPDGRFVVVADQTPDAGVWRLDGLEGVTKLPHAQKLLNDPVRRVAYDPAGCFVATGWRSSVMVWNATEWTLKRTIQCNGGLRELAVSPDGRWLAVTTALGMQMLDLQAADGVPITVHPRGMQAIAFHPNGKLIASGIDGTARIWEIETTQQLTAVTFEGRLADLSFSPDGRFLGTRTEDGIATLWNVQSGLPELHMAQLSGLSGMAFQPTGSLIATAARGDPTAIIWQPESGRSVAAIPGSSRPLYSDDGQYLAALGGVIKLSERRFASAPTGGRLISGNGRRIAVDNGDAAEIWSLADGRAVSRLEHIEPIDWKALTEREVPPRDMRGRRTSGS